MFTDLITTNAMTSMSPFDDLFKNFDELMNSSRLSFQEPFPPMNVFYSADNKSAEITLALAGYSKEELSVEVNGNTIVIEATPKKEDEKNGTYFKQRIHKKSFKRSYELPTNVYDTSKTEVEFKDGLLNIYVPAKQKEESTSKKIAIR